MLLRLLLALAIGLPLGAWTAALSIRSEVGVASLSVGEWTAWPREGSREADPYTKAKVAARGSVPLGVGEGVAFHAFTDAAGRRLDATCQYVVSGRTPKARIWTLAAHATDAGAATGPVLRRPDGGVAALTSRDLVRLEDGSFSIAVGPLPAGGDWLPLPRSVAPPARRRADRTSEPGVPKAPFRLVLRLYDSPVSTSAELFEPTMPSIEHGGCAP